jgi:hypothetical protein
MKAIEKRIKDLEQEHAGPDDGMRLMLHRRRIRALYKIYGEGADPPDLSNVTIEDVRRSDAEYEHALDKVYGAE